MSATDAALGVVALLAVAAAVVLVAVAARRWLLPTWRGAPARLVELVLGHAAALVVSLVLGTAGLLGRTGLLLCWIPLATLAAWSLRRPAPRPATPAPVAGPEEHRGAQAAALVAVVVVGAQWLSVVPSTLRTGVLAVDALHYRLTHAALFAQSGSTTRLHHLSVPDPTTYYPLDDELLQATGMVLLGADTLVVGWGMVALAGTLLSAWVLGRAWGSGSLAVLAACVLLAVTGSAVGDANDWAATWPLLAGVALLAANRGPRVLLVVGLAAGLAVGTKLTVLLPAAVLLGTALLSARDRPRAAAALGAGVLVTGGYWYLRNLLVTGSPLPQLRLGIGPLALPQRPMPELDAISASVLSYADDAGIVREWFLPGLGFALGPAWPVLLGAAAAGLLQSLVRPGGPARRAAAVMGAASAVGYLVTPTSAGGPPDLPYLFVYNIRYALVALLLGLVLLATSTWARRRPAVPAAAMVALLVSALLRGDALPQGWAPSAVFGAFGAVGGAVLLRRARPTVRAGAVAAAVLVAGVALVPLQDRYLRSRYADASDPQQRLFAAARATDAEAIGVVGFPRLYPLLGPAWQTSVRYLGRLEDDGEFADASSCRELLVLASGVDTVVVQQQYAFSSAPSAAQWLGAADGVREVFRGELGAVYVLPAGLGPDACRR